MAIMASTTPDKAPTAESKLKMRLEITDIDIGFLRKHPHKWKEIQKCLSSSTMAQLEKQINDINMLLGSIAEQLSRLITIRLLAMNVSNTTLMPHLFNIFLPKLSYRNVLSVLYGISLVQQQLLILSATARGMSCGSGISPRRWL